MSTWGPKEATRRNGIAPDEGDPRNGRGYDREEAHGTSGRADARTRRRRHGWRTPEPRQDPRTPQEHRPNPDDHARGGTGGRRGHPGGSPGSETGARGGRDEKARPREHELIGLWGAGGAASDPSKEHVPGRAVH